MNPERKETIYYLRRGGMVAFVIAVIFVGFASSMATIALMPARTSTIAETTLVSTSTKTVSNISSFTVSSFIVRTETTFSTIGVTLPPKVTVSGNATSKGIGTSATEIHFIDVKGSDYNGAVKDGKYAVLLANQDDYNVYIAYAGVVGGVGSGRCLAGALSLGTTSDSKSAAWSC